MKSFEELLRAYEVAVNELEFAEANYRLAETHPRLKDELPQLQAGLLPFRARVDAALLELKKYSDGMPDAGVQLA